MHLSAQAAFWFDPEDSEPAIRIPNRMHTFIADFSSKTAFEVGYQTD
jgi:hypothetical protein